MMTTEIKNINFVDNKIRDGVLCVMSADCSLTAAGCKN